MIACPKCGSVEQYYKVSALVEAETSSVQAESRTTGVGLAGRLLETSGQVTTTTGRMRSAMAEKVAPPEPPAPVGGGLLILSLLLFVLAMVLLFWAQNWLWGGLALLFSAFIFYVRPKVKKAVSDSKTKYGEDVALWNRQWICKRCGEVSIPDEKRT